MSSDAPRPVDAKRRHDADCDEAPPDAGGGHRVKRACTTPFGDLGDACYLTAVPADIARLVFERADFAAQVRATGAAARRITFDKIRALLPTAGTMSMSVLDILALTEVMMSVATDYDRDDFNDVAHLLAAGFQREYVAGRLSDVIGRCVPDYTITPYASPIVFDKHTPFARKLDYYALCRPAGQTALARLHGLRALHPVAWNEIVAAASRPFFTMRGFTQDARLTPDQHLWELAITLSSVCFYDHWYDPARPRRTHLDIVVALDESRRNHYADGKYAENCPLAYLIAQRIRDHAWAIGDALVGANSRLLPRSL